MPYFVTADNTRLYYTDAGEGQPIVFLHGWSSSHDSYSGIVKHMRGKYRCISYSHRGHGASSVPEGGYTIPQLARDLRELMDYLDLKHVVLVGHSMGGYTVYEYIKQFGCDNIAKVALIDISPKVLCDAEWKAGAFGDYDDRRLTEDLELISQDISKFMMKQKLPNLDVSAFPEKLVELMTLGMKGSNHTLPLLGLWHSMFSRDYRDAIPSIAVPVAYIIPEDPLFPTGAAEYVKAHAGGGAEIIDAPGCTHICIIENPLQTAQSLLGFIGGEPGEKE